MGFSSFTILSTHLLSRAKQVPANGPESRQITYVQRASGVTTFPQPFSAKRDSPMTYREITAAIDALLQRLPEDLQIRDGVWTAPEAPVIVRFFLPTQSGANVLMRAAYQPPLGKVMATRYQRR